MAPDSLTLRGAVDGAYRILDYILGYFLFFFLFLFSFLQVFNWVQGALLYNIKFSRKLEEARMLGSNNFVASYVDRASMRIGNQLKKEIEKSTLVQRGGVAAPAAATPTPRGASAPQGPPEAFKQA